MAESQGNTNIWGVPDAAGDPTPPRPRDAAEPMSASERAYYEGWPTSPSWPPHVVPGAGGGPVGGGAPLDAPAGWAGNGGAPAWPGSVAQQTYVPGQSGGTAPYGSPAAPGWPYPGATPTPPVPAGPSPARRPRTGLVVAGVVAAAVVLGGAVGGGIVLTRADSSTAEAAGTGTAPAPAVTSDGGRADSSGDTSGGASDSSTSDSGTDSGTGDSGTSSSTGGGSSTTATAPVDLETVSIPADAVSGDAVEIGTTLDAYFSGINNGDYANSWSQLTDAQQAKNPLDEFTANTLGTLDRDVVLRSASVRSDRTARAEVTFTSTQPPDKGVNPGETCTDWAITYTLVPGPGAGGWLIADTPSAQHSAC